MVSLVGSRDISPENRKFAAEAGRQAALQGYTLVSGNARGADRVAQESCLNAGGNVIVVTADGIADKREEKHILYLCEDSFDLPFSAQRALSRNRIIHCLGRMVLVAQCAWKSGGTWSGTVKNLACGWSPVFCFDDGSKAVGNLEQMGAERIGMEALGCLAALPEQQRNIFHESFLK
jgi:predicted Rossmann fold nucleotide-binding protein DprA/Smf involved in DNA uptake